MVAVVDPEALGGWFDGRLKEVYSSGDCGRDDVKQRVETAGETVVMMMLVRCWKGNVRAMSRSSHRTVYRARAGGDRERVGSEV